MVHIYRGKFYLDKTHVPVMERAPEYLKKRYKAIVYSFSNLVGYTVEKVAELVGVSQRTIYRWRRAYKEKGLQGLLRRSTRPKSSPNKTDEETEKRVEIIRERTGVGPGFIKELLLQNNQNGGGSRVVSRTTIYNILVRRGVIAREKMKKQVWRFFEWSRPNQLIQTDLTEFRGLPIKTSLDDHSRYAWARRVPGEDVESVVAAMEETLPDSFENLLSDNGMVYRPDCAEMRKYVERHVEEKHIHTSAHHPQTMGKLAVFQKKLKAFLSHVVPPDSNNLGLIDRYISLYVKIYNNALVNSRTGCKPGERYTGHVDDTWYNEFIETFNLEDILAKKEG